jgi:hypothetical protein
MNREVHVRFWESAGLQSRDGSFRPHYSDYTMSSAIVFPTE